VGLPLRATTRHRARRETATCEAATASQPRHTLPVTAADSDFHADVRRVLPSVVAVRFVINIVSRMCYTFLPAFARGSGLSVEAMGRVLSARELTALAAPLAGRLSDGLGPLRVMALGTFVAAGGLLLAMFGSIGLMVGLVIFGLGRTAHQVAMGSWIADAVAYERRGRVIGRVELTWGGASLIGLPIIGLLLGRLAWWTAFGILGAIALVLGFRVLAHASRSATQTGVVSPKPNMTGSAIAAIATNASMSGAAQFLFLGHGLWLEDTYSLDTAQVGLAIIAVGTIEIVATLGSSQLTDRLGKRRSILFGSLLMTAAMITLAAFSEPPLVVGLLLLVAAFLGFEFGIVSSLPLLAELDPQARAQMIGRSVSVGTVVRALVTLIATAIYVSEGFGLLMTIASIAGVLSCVLAAFVMVEPSPSPL